MRHGRAFVVAGACVLQPGLAGAQEALPTRLPPEGFVARAMKLDLETPKDKVRQITEGAPCPAQ